MSFHTGKLNKGTIFITITIIISEIGVEESLGKKKNNLNRGYLKTLEINVLNSWGSTRGRI